MVDDNLTANLFPCDIEENSDYNWINDEKMCNYPDDYLNNHSIDFENQIEAEDNTFKADETKQTCLNRKGQIKDKICNICGYASSETHKLKQHVKSVHDQVKDKVCTICGFATADNYRLKKHIQVVHDKIKDKICGICNYKTSQKKTLVNHVKAVHHKIKDKICTTCGYSTSFDGDLKKHISAVHELKKDQVCDICAYATSDAQSLKKHVEAVHQKIRNKVCDLCGFTAYRSAGLRRHFKSVHENVKLQTCSACTFTTTQGARHLKDHIKNVHNKIKDKICHICGFATVSKATLEKHIYVVHKKIEDEKQKPLVHARQLRPKNKVCAVQCCGFTARKNSQLASHIKAVHDKIKDHVCKKCGYASSEAGHLRQHKCKACNICSFVTAFDIDLKKHIKTVHPGDNHKAVISSTNSDTNIRCHQSNTGHHTTYVDQFKLPVGCIDNVRGSFFDEIKNEGNAVRNIKKETLEQTTSEYTNIWKDNIGTVNNKKVSSTSVVEKMSKVVASTNIKDNDYICELTPIGWEREDDLELFETVKSPKIEDKLDWGQCDDNILSENLENNHLSHNNDIQIEPISDCLVITCDDKNKVVVDLLEKTFSDDLQLKFSNKYIQKRVKHEHRDLLVQQCKFERTVCDICGLKMNSNDERQMHMKNMHKNIKQKICSICGFATSIDKNLKKHIKIVHENIKDKICSTCGYKTDNNSKLKEHIKVRSFILLYHFFIYEHINTHYTALLLAPPP